MVDGKADHEDLMAHEIAHQWFGDAASEREWSHIWLSEGFATYFAHLYDEYTHGVNKRQADMAVDRGQVISYSKKDMSPIVMTDVTDLMKLLNPNSYQKGSWVLHMLRQEIGNDNFWNGIREYYRQFKNGNALTSDLQRIMENSSGKKLDQFFNQWVYKGGHPVLELSWTYNDQAKSAQITIKQVQKGALFTFPLEIGIYGPEGALKQVESFTINKESLSVNLPVTYKPAKIELDPHINLLFEEKLKN
jgi:aminopeptidase N